MKLLRLERIRPPPVSSLGWRAPLVRWLGVVLCLRLLDRRLFRLPQGARASNEPAAEQRLEIIRTAQLLAPPPSSKALGGERITDDHYARFLSICSWDVDRAVVLLERDFSWRTRAKPATVRYKSEPQRGWVALDRRTAQRKMPCTSVTTQLWRPASFSPRRRGCIAENKRHITSLMEEMVRRLPPDEQGAVMLLNMHGFRMRCLIPYVRDGVMLCQSHYPRRLGAIVAYNLPPCFPAIWRIVKPWFNDDIRSKIVFPPRHVRSEADALDWMDERERAMCSG